MEFNTRKYEVSYGRKPAGRGNWAFEFFLPDPVESRTEVKFAPRMLLYSEAKRWAARYAVQAGHSKYTPIVVMP